jgi:hypothetical protein
MGVSGGRGDFPQFVLLAASEVLGEPHLNASACCCRINNRKELHFSVQSRAPANPTFRPRHSSVRGIKGAFEPTLYILNLSEVHHKAAPECGGAVLTPRSWPPEVRGLGGSCGGVRRCGVGEISVQARRINARRQEPPVTTMTVPAFVDAVNGQTSGRDIP